MYSDTHSSFLLSVLLFSIIYDCPLWGQNKIGYKNTGGDTYDIYSLSPLKNLISTRDDICVCFVNIFLHKCLDIRI